MRKVLLLLLGSALVLAPVSAAEASTRYKVSVKVTSNVMDVSAARSSHAYYRTTIKGRVKGGNVKGKKVSLYIRNTNAPGGGKRELLGRVKLSKSGTFSRSFKPNRGGRWVIEAVKGRSGRIRADSDTTKVDAFVWMHLDRFYEAGANNPQQAAGLVGKAKSAPTNEAEKTGPGNDYFSNQYFLQNSGQMIFDTRGYRCKKITMHIGVSKSSRTESGSYSVRQGTKTIQGGTKSKKANPDKSTEPMNARDLVRVAVSSDVRFLMGNAKVFCTYPATKIR